MVDVRLKRQVEIDYRGFECHPEDIKSYAKDSGVLLKNFYA